MRMTCLTISVSRNFKKTIEATYTITNVLHKIYNGDVSGFNL
jgi:hypothetical protein